MDYEGIDVVLTPLQLAAVLQGESIEKPSHLSAAFWGAASVVTGAAELVGAAALLLAPEPTMMTKLAGGALAFHGSDEISTGIVQITSGTTRSTVTAQGASAAAKAMGVNSSNATTIGSVVDLVVPLAAGFVGAARTLAVRRGVLSLAAEESAGGHTIAVHVGRTEAQLRARLAQQPRLKAASTFLSLRDAERAVSATLRANKGGIEAWAKAARPGERKAFQYTADRFVGHGVVRATGKLTETCEVVVVLRKVVTNNRLYFILTAYPKP
jgi:hypothetical protein